jgi:hypothetical protein
MGAVSDGVVVAGSGTSKTDHLDLDVTRQLSFKSLETLFLSWEIAASCMQLALLQSTDCDILSGSTRHGIMTLCL